MKKILFLFFLMAHTHSLFSQTQFDPNASLKAANAFLKTLNAPQKRLSNLPFEDTSRTKWSNLPFEQVVRKGIQWKDLADSQRIIIHDLLRTVLSAQGYQKMMFIIQYDEATHERLAKAAQWNAHRYGHQNYWFTIFGTPEPNKIWSWKFEGHHISLNFTYSPNGVTCTPMFVGINPALITTGAYAGSRLMFEENDFGNQLFNDLSADLKQKAIVSEHPKEADVMTQTGNEPHLKDKKGVFYTEMTAKQQVLVENILRAWVENLNPILAKEKMKQVLKHKNKLIFTWQGTRNTNDLHYYSLKMDRFIIEFTNRDGGIYHYHTLWRDLSEDFLSR
ncbi:MAG: hypothetical protein RLZZ628_556 [Bacteroidota bacterium]|jgi:hypothetical protein